jgi:X-X-X-Leu-X-X-Gly heptad repeat protein
MSHRPISVLLKFDAYPNSFWAGLEVRQDEVYLTAAELPTTIIIPISQLSRPRRAGTHLRIDVRPARCHFMIEEMDYALGFVGTNAPILPPADLRLRKILTYSFVAVSLVWMLVWGGFQILSKTAYYVITDEMEQTLGERVQDQIYENARIDTGRTRLLRQFVALMQVPGDIQFDVVVLNSDNVNAITIPGNTMFIFSALLDRLASADELAALIGHEYGHVYHDHLRKSIARNMGTTVILNTLSGGAGRISSGLSTLNNLQHSRELEQEADLMSQEVLRINALDQQATIQLLSQFKSEEAASGTEYSSWLSDHPATITRIELLQRKVMRNANNGQSESLSAVHYSRLQQLWQEIGQRQPDYTEE